MPAMANVTLIKHLFHFTPKRQCTVMFRYQRNSSFHPQTPSGCQCFILKCLTDAPWRHVVVCRQAKSVWHIKHQQQQPTQFCPKRCVVTFVPWSSGIFKTENKGRCVSLFSARRLVSISSLRTVSSHFKSLRELPPLHLFTYAATGTWHGSIG